MTEPHPITALAKRMTAEAKGQLLTTFSFVPDDKLNWTPAETSKSALRIVAHCAVWNHVFCVFILRQPRTNELIDEARRKELTLHTREEVIAALEESHEKLQEALDSITSEDIDSLVETPAFTKPFTFFMLLPAGHMDGHSTQIDYLQTMWGDMEVHF